MLMRQESGTDEAEVGLLLVLKVLKEADEAGVEEFFVFIAVLAQTLH